MRGLAADDAGSACPRRPDRGIAGALQAAGERGGIGGAAEHARIAQVGRQQADVIAHRLAVGAIGAEAFHLLLGDALDTRW